MKRVAILAAGLALSPVPAAAVDYAWPVLRVIDGNTIVFDASADLPAELAELRVRLRGIDTPEIGHRAECDEERKHGEAARNLVSDLLGVAETVVVRDPGWGKWGGRVVADIVINGERSLEELLETGTKIGVFRLSGWCDLFRSKGPATRAELKAEAEEFVIDPCIKAAVRNRIPAVAPFVAGLSEAQAVEQIKTIGAPEIMKVAPMMHPLVDGRPWSMRQKLYGFMLDLCIADYAGGLP